MKKKLGAFFAAILMLPVTVSAQNSVRDTDIDSKLNADALTGVAPPTGARTAPVPSSGSQTFIDPYLPAALQSGKVIPGQTDGKARVYEIQGNVILAKKGSPVERKINKGDVIEAGDTVRTESGSSVSITFDENYKNAVQIPADSTAVFKSIEPTDIKIENGSVFSAVDGLPQGAQWKVSTPAAVAAVRGTLYLVRYQAANGQFFAATVNVPDDGKASSIEIEDVTGKGDADVPEGKEISLKEGEVPDDSLVKDLDQTVLDEILKFFKDLADRRNDENSGAPPTGGELTGTNHLDPAGPGVVGGDSDQIGIEDTGVITDPVEIDEPSSSDSFVPPQEEQQPPR